MGYLCSVFGRVLLLNGLVTHLQKRSTKETKKYLKKEALVMK